MENFNVNCKDVDELSILYLEGFLDAHTAPLLESEIQKLVDRDRYKLIVNFKDLNYISSAGLGVFMGFVETIRSNQGDIKMCCMPSKIFRVFDLLGFPSLYDIVDGEEEAVKLYRNSEAESSVKQNSSQKS
ncbi:MAG: STAS domain-containing protein [candidate division KSB1 bacterium]|nr:STAS domain-containing protein [candidate division KSB1 bacterium]